MAAEKPDALRDRLRRRGTHVVTLTVTEAGYDAQHPDVAADLAGEGSPRTPVGHARARAWRRGRAAGVDTPLAIVSCDNLPRNGEVLRGLVDGLLRARRARGASDWIAAHVDFPSTMVDRIVPATTAADRDTASRLIGARDEATVVGEPFRQWVIEDAFRGRRRRGRPPARCSCPTPAPTRR